MDNDTNESESTYRPNPYRPNSALFIFHMKAGYMDCARRYNVLERVCGADSKAYRDQVNAANDQTIADIITEFNKAFVDNAEVDFDGRIYRFGDIEKVDILDGNSRGESHTYASVVNPNT